MDLVRNEWMFVFMDLVRNEWMFGFMDLVRNEQVNVMASKCKEY